jgi:hypothetical protein
MSEKFRKPSPAMEADHQFFPTGEDGRLSVEGHEMPELLPDRPLTRDQEINRLYSELGFDIQSDMYDISADFLPFQFKRSVINYVLNFIGTTHAVRIDEERQGAITLSINRLIVDDNLLSIYGEIPIQFNYGVPLVIPYNGVLELDELTDSAFDMVVSKTYKPVTLEDLVHGLTEIVAHLREGVRRVSIMPEVEEAFDVAAVDAGEDAVRALAEAKVGSVGLKDDIHDGKVEIPKVAIAGEAIEAAWLRENGDIASELGRIIKPIEEALKHRDSLVFIFPGVTLFAIGSVKNNGFYDYHAWVELVSESLTDKLRERGVNVEITVTELTDDVRLDEKEMPRDFAFELNVCDLDELD